MRVIIVHGIHTGEDATWMDQLASMFREKGLPTLVWTYGYAYALLTRWQNPGRARKLAELIHPGDIVVGHSNGGALAWMAAHDEFAPLGGAVLLNPALDRNRVMPIHVPWVNLYPNRYDVAVKVAKIFPAHPWGSQGQGGLSREDNRYLTRFTNESGPSGELAVRGHSAVINEGLLSWGPRIVQDALDRI